MAKLDPFLSLDCARVERGGAIQGKEGIKFCHLATLDAVVKSSLPSDVTAADGEAEPALGPVLEVARAHLQQLRGDLHRAHGLVHLLVRHGGFGV